jgi:hypothetical protein
MYMSEEGDAGPVLLYYARQIEEMKQVSNALLKIREPRLQQMVSAVEIALSGAKQDPLSAHNRKRRKNEKDHRERKSRHHANKLEREIIQPKKVTVSKPDKADEADKDDDDDDDDEADKVEKVEKAGKAGKAEKPQKAEKVAKSKKAAKAEPAETSDKAGKAGKTDKAEKPKLGTEERAALEKAAKDAGMTKADTAPATTPAAAEDAAPETGALRYHLKNTGEVWTDDAAHGAPAGERATQAQIDALRGAVGNSPGAMAARGGGRR